MNNKLKTQEEKISDLKTSVAISEDKSKSLKHDIEDLKREKIKLETTLKENEETMFEKEQLQVVNDKCKERSMFEKLTETKRERNNDLIRKLEAAKSDHDTERKKLSLLIEDTKSESEKNVIKLNEQIEKLKGEREGSQGYSISVGSQNYRLGKD